MRISFLSRRLPRRYAPGNDVRFFVRFLYAEDETGKMNLGLDAVQGEVMVVSQFTLYGNCRKGRRPSFVEAAGPELGNALYEKFLAICEELGYPPQHGQFGADMKVESINDGPVTLILDTDQLMNEPRR